VATYSQRPFKKEKKGIAKEQLKKPERQAIVAANVCRQSKLFLN
jgi:hypothetical protein